MNKSCEFPIEIKKSCFLELFVAEPEHLEFRHATTQTKVKSRQKTKPKKIYQGTKKQVGGFLNRYDFAYAGRDTVNQPAAQGVIKNASNKINNIAKQRINQIITEGGKEVERVLPKILRGTIEDEYQTSFRMLRNF